MNQTEQEKKQAMVDEIAHRLRTNTLENAYSQDDSACQFITDQGKRCFIGIRIPMDWLEENKGWVNGVSLEDFVYDIQEHLPATAATFPRVGDNFDLPFLSGYQYVHDEAAVAWPLTFVTKVKAGMTALCLHYELTWPPDLTVEVPHAVAE